MTSATSTQRSIRAALVVLAVLLVVASVPLVVSAQATTRTGGVVVVGENETIGGDLQATGGTVLIEGTVDGDVEATAGSLVVTGRVTGGLDATAGSVSISGVVDGDARVASGSLLVREGATVGGDLVVAAGDVRLDGSVGSDARLAGESVTVGPTASVGGDLRYDAEEFDLADGASVAGRTERVDSVEFGPGFGAPVAGSLGVPSVPAGAFTVYALLVNLLLGALLLYALPTFSDAVATHGTTETLRSGGYGLLTAVTVPILLVVLALTIVGLPLSVVGVVLFAVTLWAASIYGSYALGTWALSLVDRRHRWGALAVGLVVFALLGFVPVVGGLLRLVVVLVGLGAFVLAVRHVGGDGTGPERSEEGTEAVGAQDADDESNAA